MNVDHAEPYMYMLVQKHRAEVFERHGCTSAEPTPAAEQEVEPYEDTLTYLWYTLTDEGRAEVNRLLVEQRASTAAAPVRIEEQAYDAADEQHGDGPDDAEGEGGVDGAVAPEREPLPLVIAVDE